MGHAVAEANDHQSEPARPDVVSDLSAFRLGQIAGSTIASLSPDSNPELLIHLAIAKRPEDIHSTILSINAGYAALNMASAAASAT